MRNNWLLFTIISISIGFPVKIFSQFKVRSSSQSPLHSLSLSSSQSLSQSTSRSAVQESPRSSVYPWPQPSSDVGTWQTWFSLPADQLLAAGSILPPVSGADIDAVLKIQQSLDSAGRANIAYWNAGSPGYRWIDLMNANWMRQAAGKGVLANMLLAVSIYDATVLAWRSKYLHKRKRPFETDGRIRSFAIDPVTPSYPCEHSVAAGVAVAIFGHFFPTLADTVNKLAAQATSSRIAAGLAFPSDTWAGFELGKKIAEIEIELTKDFITTEKWDGRIPAGPRKWNGPKPSSPMAGKNKTMVLKNGSEFRPAPPPDFSKDMDELKSYKPNFYAKANAFFFASESYWDVLLHQKIFEYNFHLDPPVAARIYAAAGVATYDGFIACWDAKYAYWGIRPDQYDTSYKPLVGTPPFPGYPSGHAAISATTAGVYSWFFPADRLFFEKRAKDAAESRFQAGIHFRTDNVIGLELGTKVAAAIVEKIRSMQ